MSYLVVAGQNQSTSYNLTNQCDKPRLGVSGSYIPITTNTGGGVAKLADDNSTYRMMQYTTTSSSSSASAAYLTSNVNSQGLSNTTALTRVQTTGVEYLTSQKITDTIYETASTSVSTVYISSTQKKTSLQGEVWVSFTSHIRYTLLYTSTSGTSTQHWGDGTDVTITNILTTWNSMYNEITTSSPTLIRSSIATYFRTSYTGGRFGVTSPHNAYITANTRILNSLIEDPPVFVTNVTTNTIYRTSADTYDTIYLTSASTSGYSGISSSSSSVSASATTWA